MAFEPVYSDLTPSYPQRLAAGQAVIEARLLPGGYSVGKVLSAAADVSVTCGEVFTGEARYSGKANFRVIVLDEEGACRCLDYVAEFSDKLTSDAITAHTQPILSCRVLDTDIVLATEREIKLACVAEVTLTGIVEESVRALTGGGEGVYTHDDKLEYARLTGRGNETRSFSDTIPADAEEVLSVEPRSVVLRRTVGSDGVTVEGVIISDITAKHADGIISIRHETPYSAELSAVGAGGADVAIVQAQVVSYTAEFIGGESPSVICDYTLAFNYCTFGEESANPVCDAFSVTHELLLSGESIKFPVPVVNETIFERIEGKVTLDDHVPPADKILAVCGARLGVTSAQAGDGKLTVEGVAAASIIYASEDGQKASSAVELPFSVTVSAPLKEGDSVTADGIVSSVAVKVRRDGALEIKADIAVEYSACREEVKYVIGDLTVGEERALPTGAVAIHVARKGETLWEAAKALGTTPENVLLQNPDVTLPLSGGERVVAYRCLAPSDKA